MSYLVKYEQERTCGQNSVIKRQISILARNAVLSNNNNSNLKWSARAIFSWRKFYPPSTISSRQDYPSHEQSSPHPITRPDLSSHPLSPNNTSSRNLLLPRLLPLLIPLRHPCTNNMQPNHGMQFRILNLLPHCRAQHLDLLFGVTQHLGKNLKTKGLEPFHRLQEIPRADFFQFLILRPGADGHGELAVHDFREASVARPAFEEGARTGFHAGAARGADEGAVGFERRAVGGDGVVGREPG